MTEKQTKFKETEIGMIPEDWTVSPIGNVCSVRRGASPRPIHNFISESGMPWVKISDASAQNTRFIEWTGEFIKQEGVKNSVTVHPGDLIVSNSATPGIPRFMKIDACIHDGWLLIENFKESTKEFLYYTFLNERSKLVGIADGTVFRNLKTDIVRDHKIALPEVKEQRAIASILSSLDDKIELNQRMNKTLEEIGQAIFKHWFIDFEFPNEEGKLYKSAGGEMVYNEELGKEIPKGWRVGRLGDGILTSISKPGIDNFVGEKIYLDTASVQNTDIISLNDYITFDKRPSRANMQPKIGSVWFAKMKDSKKVLFFDDYSTFGLDNFILSTGFLGLSVKSSALYYIWNIISSDEFERQKSNLCNGTTMQAINNVTVQSIKALVPDEKVLIKFNEAVKSLYNRIYINFVESQILSQIRDLLLPKLMSGKIRVPLEGKE